MKEPRYVDIYNDFYCGVPDNNTPGQAYFSNNIELNNIFEQHKQTHNFNTHIFSFELKELLMEFPQKNKMLVVKTFLKNLGHFFVYVGEFYGKDGKKIKIPKFRSMMLEAESLIDELDASGFWCMDSVGKGMIDLAKSNELTCEARMEDGQNLEGRFLSDPRITKLGEILRKLKIDELPQIVSLLKGDIKLVGYRAKSEGTLEKHYAYNGKLGLRDRMKKVKPGLLPPIYKKANASVNNFEAEKEYMDAYEKNAFLTDLEYGFKIVLNILTGRAKTY